MSKNPCAECGASKARMNRAHQIRLCVECAKLDEYDMICKTEAKKKYYLTDADLENCDCIEVESLTYRSTMYLYKRVDVISEFCVKYGADPNDEDSIQEAMDEIVEKKDEARLKREANVKKRRKKRKQDLIAALDAYGLELRPDSKLCSGYINGTCKDWTIDKIVKRMCQMKYLYEYCRMDKCYQKAVREQELTWEAGYIPDVPLEVEAEDIALAKYGYKGGYPKKWPWMK